MNGGDGLEGIATIILAAGKGTRMKSDLVKVLHPLLGLPMLAYPIDLSLNGVQSEKTIVVVGYQADQIKERFKDPRILFTLQKEQLGTGHAVLQAVPLLQGFTGTVLILCGDVPLVKEETIRSFIEDFRKERLYPLGYDRRCGESPWIWTYSSRPQGLARKDC